MQPTNQPSNSNFFEGTDPKINFKDNISIAFNAVCESVKLERSGFNKGVKTGLAVLGGIVLIITAIALSCITTLGFILAFPIIMTMRGWTIHEMKNYYYSSLKEIKAFFITFVTNPINCTQFNPHPLKEGETAEKTPILCVNGYLHNSSAWHYMRNKLEKEGTGPIYTISVGSPFESLKDKAARVKLMVDKIAKDTNRNDLVLIGHSMGGVVSSEFATDPKLASKTLIKAVITLGSPLQGTNMAKIGIGQAAREMTYGSKYIKELQNQINQTAKKIKFYHLGSKTDLIVPGLSAINTDTKNQSSSEGFRHQYDRCGHATLLYSEDVADHVVQAYRHATEV